MTSKTKIASAMNRTSILKAAALGAGIAFLAILFFIGGAESQPHWPDNWRVRPLIVTPLVGAFGGGFCHFSIKLLQQLGLNKSLAVILSLAGFFIMLWLGIILGLDGTLWD